MPFGTTKDDRKEAQKLNNDYNKTMSLFVAGTLKSKKSGELTSLDFAAPTQGFLD